ncbi:cysteine rich repeat-containing protein [Kaarinaea lacus]
MKLCSYVVLLCISMVVGMPSLIYAAPPGPCFADREKFCNDVKPGAGRIFECLEEHEDELSTACKDHIETMTQKFQQFVDVCSTDLAKYCPQVKPGQGRGIACLRGNEDKLSAACRNALPSSKDAD